MAATDRVLERLSLNPASFSPEDIITKDVCIIGGGASGTYTAVRLRDFNKSVIVIEAKNRLGGHAETYKDPKSGTTLDIGVILFGHLEEVKNYFSRFDIPLNTVPTSLGPPDHVNFATGEAVNFTPPDQVAVGDAFQRYAAQIAKYPDVQAGFHLTYPIPEDLLLPFGQFVEKHSLGALIPTIFALCHGYIPLLEISTLYVIKYFNTDLLDTLGKGFLMTERNNVGELYEKAVKEFGSDALLNSSVVAMDRSSITRPARILVDTPSGRKLILAKKIVSAIPPKFDHLSNFDLSLSEKSLFAQFYNTAYYAGILRSVGLPSNVPIHSLGPNQPYSLPDLPGIYSINPSAASGLFQVCYGSPHPLPEDQVRADIIAAVQWVQEARGISATTPEFVAFANHTPFNMMVSNDAIKSGFYERLDALQGKRHTFYNGAAFHTQDSSALWRFTEQQSLPRILAAL